MRCSDEDDLGRLSRIDEQYVRSDVFVRDLCAKMASPPLDEDSWVLKMEGSHFGKHFERPGSSGDVSRCVIWMLDDEGLELWIDFLESRRRRVIIK